MTNSPYILIPLWVALPIGLLIGLILWIIVLHPIWQSKVIRLRHRLAGRNRHSQER